MCHGNFETFALSPPTQLIPSSNAHDFEKEVDMAQGYVEMSIYPGPECAKTYFIF